MVKLTPVSKLTPPFTIKGHGPPQMKKPSREIVGAFGLGYRVPLLADDFLGGYHFAAVAELQEVDAARQIAHAEAAFAVDGAAQHYAALHVEHDGFADFGTADAHVELVGRRVGIDADFGFNDVLDALGGHDAEAALGIDGPGAGAVELQDVKAVAGGGVAGEDLAAFTIVGSEDAVAGDAAGKDGGSMMLGGCEGAVDDEGGVGGVQDDGVGGEVAREDDGAAEVGYDAGTGGVVGGVDEGGGHGVEEVVEGAGVVMPAAAVEDEAAVASDEDGIVGVAIGDFDVVELEDGVVAEVGDDAAVDAFDGDAVNGDAAVVADAEDLVGGGDVEADVAADGEAGFAADGGDAIV